MREDPADLVPDARASPRLWLVRPLAMLMIACGRVIVAYIQLVFTVTRLLPDGNDPWPMPNIVAGMFLIHRPLILPLGINFLGRKNSADLIVVSHFFGMSLAPLFWFL